MSERQLMRLTLSLVALGVIDTGYLVYGQGVGREDARLGQAFRSWTLIWVVCVFIGWAITRLIDRREA